VIEIDIPIVAYDLALPKLRIEEGGWFLLRDLSGVVAPVDHYLVASAAKGMLDARAIRVQCCSPRVFKGAIDVDSYGEAGRSRP
jgi:hypothetical protein